MSTEALKSAEITNLDASPSVKNNVFNSGARLRRYFSTDEAAGGGAGSTYRLIRVRGSDIIHRVELATDDLGVATTLDLGLYDVNDDAVEDADFFASAVDVATAAVARTDVTYESGVIDIANAGKQLWEQLGLSDTPENREKLFDIYATSGAAAATGTISVWVELARQD